MKLKLNKLFILLVFVCAFFVFTPYVFADEPLECWYSISGNNPETLSSENRVQLYIKAQNGKVDYSFSQFKKNVNGREVQYSSAKIVNDVIPFESMKDTNNSSKLGCPVIYYRSSLSNGIVMNYEMSVYRDKVQGDNFGQMNLYKWNVPSEESSDTSNARSCGYYQENESSPSLTIDIDSNGNVNVPNNFSKSGSFDDSSFSSSCPEALWVDYGVQNHFVIYTSEQSGSRIEKLTYNNRSLAPDSQYDENGNSSGDDFEATDLPTGNPLTCEALESTETFQIIKQIYGWLEIAAPIILIIFGVMDFAKAIASSDNEALKKAQAKFVKRLIIVAAIILLPIIFKLLFGFLPTGLKESLCNLR